MNKYVQKIIQEYTYPKINSLAFPNGDLLVLSGYKVNKNYILRIICKSSLESYFHYNDKSCVSHFAVPTVVTNSEYSVFAGEGSWGDEGIVFVMDKSKETLLWFLFLDNSNPFEEVKFETSNIIIVQSSSGLRIRIPIDNPESLKVLTKIP
ncbi:MAG: hypothetical protein ACK5IQ_01585 [Bacteroidales bacterium]